MGVKIKKSILENYLHKILFEQHVNSAYTAKPEERQIFAEPVDTERVTVPQELPISASEEMATQLSTERPPVEDPEYTPANPIELGRAADVIAQQVPGDQVEWFYLRLNSLLKQANDRQGNPEVSRKKEVKQESMIYERLKQIVHTLVEQVDDDAPDEMGLEDLAKEFGYKAPSGVRQDLERIMKRMGFTVEKISPEALQSLQDYAVGEFIDGLINVDLIEPDDIVELQQNPNEVRSLDSFRFFFVSGFMLPAYQKIIRDARRRVEAELDQIDVPSKTRQTILNQAFGDTPKSMDKLSTKLSKDASGEGWDQNKTNDAIKDVQDMFYRLQSLANIEGDLVSGALEMWQKAGKAKKERVLQQALQSTTEFQGP